MSLRLVDSLEDRLARAHEAAPALEALGAARRIELLLDATARLRELARAELEPLAQSSGLRLPSVRWALESSLSAVTGESLRAIVRGAEAAGPEGARARPRGVHAVILAGNVFTAPLRALLVPLALGNPVLAKASPRSDLFAHLLGRALAETGKLLEDAACVMTFSSADDDLTARLLSRVHTVAAYGSDETMRALRGHLGPGTRFSAHGHGLGLAFVAGDGSDAEVEAFAEDVIAYDQRGCLSPHALLLTGDASRFCARLEKALAGAAFRRPRGSLPAEIGAAQIQWRGVARARGELFEGVDFAVALEPEGRPRLSPGYRNVAVLPVASQEAFQKLAGSFGAHLKAVGVGGVDPSLLALPLGVTARVSALGQMQRPPLESPWEGAPAHDGLVAYL